MTKVQETANKRVRDTYQTPIKAKDDVVIMIPPQYKNGGSKTKPPFVQSDADGQAGELHDRINNLEFLNKVVTSDLQRSNLLLREVLSQLYKDKDEYHADLHDKIVKELGE